MGIEEIVRTVWQHIEARFKRLCDNITCCCAGSEWPVSGEFKRTLFGVNLEPSLLGVTYSIRKVQRLDGEPTQ